MKTIKITALLALGILLILLVVQNTAPVQARLLWLEAELPVIVLLLVVGIAAFVAGILFTMLRGKKKGSGKRGASSRRPVPPAEGNTPPQAD
ncbi:MAG: DUF1049 domain-containing protein [Rhodothermales bacterium]|nr:DUF1049 domain-containing protein [Rhodothermales bacterium]